MMKRVLVLAVVVGAVAFTSCNKKGDYTCECSGAYEATAEMTDVTEDDAQETCDDLGSNCTLTKK